jgi:oxygen-dependent protoporphyrinogen oxidase
METPRTPRIAVVGGGISGLAAAHRLQELSRERGKPIEVHLLEAGDRLGGVIATERRDGFLLEAGPDSFITDKPWALALCRRLGLEHRLIGTNDAHRRSFVARGGTLHPVPEGFQLLAPSRLGPFLASSLFSWPGKLRMAMEPLIPARRDPGDESLAAFVERRLGREALDRIAQPMIAGIYGADPRQLSIEATLPRFAKMEREHGSLLRAMRARRRPTTNDQRPTTTDHRRSTVHGAPSTEHRMSSTGDQTSGTSGARYGLFVSFDAGMQVLVDALVERLPAEWVSLGARVTGVRREGAAWALSIDPSAPCSRLPSSAGGTTPLPEAERGERLESHETPPLRSGEGAGGRGQYSALCLALPAHRAAELLAPLDTDMGRRLRDIRYGWSGTVNLAYRRADVPHPLNGFGFVVPSAEGLGILGCTFCSVKFAGRAPDDHALLRAFLGREDGDLESIVRADLRGLLGITAAPLFTTVHRHPAAMAHYAVGHLERVGAIEERVRHWPGLALAGNGYHGIGIPDCVHSGERAAEALWQSLFGDVAS